MATPTVGPDSGLRAGWFKEASEQQLRRAFAAASLNPDATKNYREYLAALSPDGSTAPTAECRGNICRILIDSGKVGDWSRMLLAGNAGQVEFKLARERGPEGELIVFLSAEGGPTL